MADQNDNQNARNTEQWLQAYARRRREEHGPETEMHEATRQMLHGEIRRTWGQNTLAKRATPAHNGWEAWLLKLATGTVTVGAVALGTWALMDESQPGGNGGMQMTRAEDTARENQAETAAQPSRQNEQEDNHLPADRLHKTAHGEALEQAHGSAGMAEEKAKKREHDQGQGAPPSIAANAVLSDNLRSRKMNFAPRDVASKVDAYSNMRRNFNTTQTARSQAKSLRIESPVRGTDDKAGKAEMVMQNFELQRVGNSIQVRDQDGSVYTGRVILASAVPVAAAVTGPNAGRGQQLGGRTTPAAPRPASPTAPGAGGKGLPTVVVTPAKPAPRPVAPPPLGPGGLRPALVQAQPGQYNPAVPHDNVENPLRITKLNAPLLSHNMHATRQPGNESLHLLFPNFHGRSVWFLFEAPKTGWADVSTRGSNFDTTVGVFKGNAPGNINYVKQGGIKPVWNNDVASGNGPWSEVRFPCLEGAKYRVAVDGVRGSTGQIKLTTRFKADPAAAGVAQKAIADEALFYFQVAGTNRKSGQTVQFEGYVSNNAHTEKKSAALAKAAVETQAAEGGKPKESLSLKKQKDARLADTETLLIQGRASYGRQQLSIDAITAAALPVPGEKGNGKKR